MKFYWGDPTAVWVSVKSDLTVYNIQNGKATTHNVHNTRDDEKQLLFCESLLTFLFKIKAGTAKYVEVVFNKMQQSA